MGTTRALIVYKCLSLVIGDGGLALERNRRTDVIGLACQYGKRYEVTRKECEELIDKSLRELVELTGGTFGKAPAKR